LSIFCAYSVRKTGIRPRIKSESLLLRNTRDLPFYAGGIRDKPPPETLFVNL